MARQARPALRPASLAVGRAATLALYDELALSPKPSLVTLTDQFCLHRTRTRGVPKRA